MPATVGAAHGRDRSVGHVGGRHAGDLMLAGSFDLA